MSFFIKSRTGVLDVALNLSAILSTLKPSLNASTIAEYERALTMTSPLVDANQCLQDIVQVTYPRPQAP